MGRSKECWYRKLRLREQKISVLNNFLQKIPTTEEQQPNRFGGEVHNDLQPVLGQKIICMTVDGSVKNEQRGAGVILKDDRCRLTKIPVPVDGNKQDITSYRTELNVIYSGYQFLS